MHAFLICAGAISGLSATATAAPVCRGDYAEDLSALSPAARELEAKTPPYSYAVRTSAVYECVSYGSDGNLRRNRTTATAHGTAFGLRADGGDTLLLTNQHVAEWPAVTDDDHPVDGVPAGCKRVSDSLKIVDDDHDEYVDDDVPLARVVVDPALDIAVLRAHAKLQVIPWRIGRSAGVAARAAVEVKGFPLGELRATNIGKVISAYDHDTQNDWNHDDFVVDALLSPGGSGSPVLAISCATGEFELVGVFHAHYGGASAMNVVIAIDQLHELITTLKRTPRPDPTLELDAATRARLVQAVRSDPAPPFFAVGPLVASLRERADGTLVFAVFPSDFPRTAGALLVVEDHATDDVKQFGKLGAVYVGGTLGLQKYAAADADADTQASIARTLALLRAAAVATFDYRAAARTTATSRTDADRLASKKRALARMLGAQRDGALLLVDLAGHIAPKASGVTLPLQEVEAGPHSLVTASVTVE